MFSAALRRSVKLNYEYGLVKDLPDIKPGSSSGPVVAGMAASSDANAYSSDDACQIRKVSLVHLGLRNPKTHSI